MEIFGTQVREEGEKAKLEGVTLKVDILSVFFYVEGVLLLSFYFNTDKNVIIFKLKKIYARNNFTISFPVCQNSGPKMQFS